MTCRAPIAAVSSATRRVAARMESKSPGLCRPLWPATLPPATVSPRRLTSSRSRSGPVGRYPYGPSSRYW